MEGILLHIPPFKFPRHSLVVASWHRNSICTDFPSVPQNTLQDARCFRFFPWSESQLSWQLALLG